MTQALEPVLLDVSPEGVAVLTLNRPAQANAIDELLAEALLDALATLKGADHVRILFVRGAGDDFCSGADRAMLGRWSDRTQDEIEADLLPFGRALKALHDLPMFTVALVQGAARGGGGGLVAACDWAAARADANFQFGEIRHGLIPAIAAPYVIEAIGARAARGLFASAEMLTAARAYALGLVQEVVDGETGLDSVLKRLAGRALENAPGAVEGRLAERRVAEEGREGFAALSEKRPPNWDAGQR
jgi:methylglutaconyl-CoA hydratase